VNALRDRQRGTEILDDPDVPAEVITRSMADVALANTLFGGTHAAMSELRNALGAAGQPCSLLDVGTGRGDIATRARLVARRRGVDLWTVGIDMAEPLVAAHRHANSAVVRGDALALPFASDSVDIVLCSQLLHHFVFDDAVKLVREMDRVARATVIICDLRRSVFAVAGLWAASFPLRFHPVSRHDGMVSVMRGFVERELADIVEAAVGQRPRVRKRLGFRLTTKWAPADISARSSR